MHVDEAAFDAEKLPANMLMPIVFPRSEAKLTVRVIGALKRVERRAFGEVRVVRYHVASVGHLLAGIHYLSSTFGYQRYHSVAQYVRYSRHWRGRHSPHKASK